MKCFKIAFSIGFLSYASITAKALTCNDIVNQPLSHNGSTRQICQAIVDAKKGTACSGFLLNHQNNLCQALQLAKNNSCHSLLKKNHLTIASIDETVTDISFELKAPPTRYRHCRAFQIALGKVNPPLTVSSDDLLGNIAGNNAENKTYPSINQLANWYRNLPSQYIGVPNGDFDWILYAITQANQVVSLEKTFAAESKAPSAPPHSWMNTKENVWPKIDEELYHLDQILEELSVKRPTRTHLFFKAIMARVQYMTLEDLQKAHLFIQNKSQSKYEFSSLLACQYLKDKSQTVILKEFLNDFVDKQKISFINDDLIATILNHPFLTDDEFLLLWKITNKGYNISPKSRDLLIHFIEENSGIFTAAQLIQLHQGSKIELSNAANKIWENNPDTLSISDKLDIAELSNDPTYVFEHLLNTNDILADDDLFRAFSILEMKKMKKLAESFSSSYLENHNNLTLKVWCEVSQHMEPEAGDCLRLEHAKKEGIPFETCYKLAEYQEDDENFDSIMNIAIPKIAFASFADVLDAIRIIGNRKRPTLQVQVASEYLTSHPQILVDDFLKIIAKVPNKEHKGSLILKLFEVRKDISPDEVASIFLGIPLTVTTLGENAQQVLPCSSVTISFD